MDGRMDGLKEKEGNGAIEDVFLAWLGLAWLGLASPRSVSVVVGYSLIAYFLWLGSLNLIASVGRIPRSI